MESVERSRTFMAQVVRRKGKEGSSVYVTIPLAVRDLFGLKGGEIVQLSIWSVEAAKVLPEVKKK